jgi:copper chaperone CopZ
MKEMVIKVPGMWADHHVLQLRDSLLSVKGVSEVIASSARRTALVRYDEAAASDKAILDAVISAGYGPDQTPVMSDFPKRHEDGSEWYAVLDRKTITERKDREMAGDFRRY